MRLKRFLLSILVLFFIGCASTQGIRWTVVEKKITYRSDMSVVSVEDTLQPVKPFDFWTFIVDTSWMLIKR
jgi:hypothetical protein